MRKGRRFTTGAAGVVIAVALLALGGCGSDDPATNAGTGVTAGQLAQGATTAPTAPGASTPALSPDVVAGASRSASVSPSPAKVGSRVLVRGANWPANGLVTATVCGNLFLNGQGDCAPSASGQTNATPAGDILIDLVVQLPPKPCPCVVRVASLTDTTAVNAPFEIIGAPTGPTSQVVTRRSVDVNSRIIGSGPWTSLFGGAAKREVVVQVRNTGTGPLTNLPVNLAFGKGQDPTDPITQADGTPVVIASLEAGQSVEVNVPLTIPPIPFGSYRVKGSFVGLDSVSVDNVQNNAGDLSFSSTTSAYPWLLIVVGWLLLQIPLLGLYKRRPVTVEQLDELEEDPLIEQLPTAGAAAGFAGGIFDPSAPVPGVQAAGAPVAAVAGAALVGAAAVGAVGGASAPPPPPGYQSVGPVMPVMPPVVAAQPLAAVPVAAAAAAVAAPQSLPPMPPVVGAAPAAPAVPAPVPVASSVFGVNDLRSMMQPPSSTLPAMPPVPGDLPAAPAPASPETGVDALRSLLQSPPPAPPQT